MGKGALHITQSQMIAVFMAGRCNEQSTELCLTLAGITEPKLVLQLWGGEPGQQKLIGYLSLRLCNTSKEKDLISGNYLLDQLLPPGPSPSLSQAASLSGVLWNRRAIS